MQDQYESLAQILHKLKQSKKGRLIIDDSLSTISLNYQELEIILRDVIRKCDTKNCKLIKNLT